MCFYACLGYCSYALLEVALPRNNCESFSKTIQEKINENFMKTENPLFENLADMIFYAHNYASSCFHAVLFCFHEKICKW